MVRTLALLTTLSLSPSLEAGVYLLVDNQGVSDPQPLFAIVHPPGYTGTADPLTVRVCTSAGSAVLAGPVQGAIATWNALTPLTGNCPMCKRVEDIDSVPPFGQNVESVILHELGHCGMGLAHVNLLLNNVPSSATSAAGTTVVDIGSDGVLGSSDDRHFPQPPAADPARIIHWFRNVDNDPVIVDGLTIDADTFTRLEASFRRGIRGPRAPIRTTGSLATIRRTCWGSPVRKPSCTASRMRSWCIQA